MDLVEQFLACRHRDAQGHLEASPLERYPCLHPQEEGQEVGSHPQGIHGPLEVTAVIETF